MDTVSKKFYVGNINNFGFGTWNSGVPIFKNNLRNNNNILNNNNNNNNNIPFAAPTPASSNYQNSTAFPIPKTLYSMNNNNLAQSVTIPFRKTMDPNEKTLNSNFNNNGYETRKNFNPENLKIQVLEEKIRNIEKKNEDDSSKFQQMILNSLNNNKNKNNEDNDGLKNLIKNLQGDDIDEEYDIKRGKRREQIKFELEQAREKLKHSSSSSDYEEEEEEEEELDENGEPKLKNFNDYSSIASKTTNNKKINKKRKSINPKNNIIKDNQTKSNNVIFVNDQIPNNLSNPLMKQKTPAQEEADEFINSIPNHIALQLQSDNFKVRANLAYIKNSFRDIRNDIQNKLDQLEMRQKLNFESIRYALEAGGNKKLQMSLKKIVDGEEVDIDGVEEEVPQFLDNLPNIIDQRILDIDQKRKIEDEKERKEEELMMQDEKNLILPPIGRMNNIYNLYADNNNNGANNNMIGNKNNFMYDIPNNNNNNQYIQNNNNNNINYLKSNLQPQNFPNNNNNFNNNYNNNFNNNNFNNNLNNNNNNFNNNLNNNNNNNINNIDNKDPRQISFEKDSFSSGTINLKPFKVNTKYKPKLMGKKINEDENEENEEESEESEKKTKKKKKRNKKSKKKYEKESESENSNESEDESSSYKKKKKKKLKRNKSKSKKKKKKDYDSDDDDLYYD